MKGESKGWTRLALAVAFALPTLAAFSAASAENEKNEDPAASVDKGLSKEDLAKLKEHKKLRTEISRVKYPASKAVVVSHVKGIKPDDKKWFEGTLPDRTYGSASEVMLALGWEIESPANADKGPDPQPKSRKLSAGEKTETRGSSGTSEKTAK